jgi:DNA topoisomerase-2
MTKHISQTYQVLDEIEHIRKRTGMYAGSIADQTSEEWIYDVTTKKMVKQKISYIPALVKIFSEILDNAIDESRRAPEILDSVRVYFEDDGTIIVQDNGRGIPVEVHPQTGKYVAETIFSNLRAGSNFNDEDDQQLIGTNGVGSTLTNVLSSSFKIESCDGKKVLRQEFWNGMRDRSEPVIKPDNKNRTKITFKPDYEFFKQSGLTEGNCLRMMKKVVDAAACNPSVKFYINSERVAVRDFDDYVTLYTDTFVSDITPDWKVAVSASDGFEQISFVNSVETYQGGSHVLYVVMQIANELRAIIKKKHKIDIPPAQIREHLRVYISANINRPKFSSQTKENMISPVSDYKTSWTVPDKMINKIVKSAIIQNILDWAAAKQHQEEMKELRKLNKETDKADPRRVEKFSDALEKKERHKCVLFLTEGDSAAKAVQAGRGKNPYIASFPLRGKPLNVREKDTKRILDNEEIKKILTITGLKLGEKVTSVAQLRFGRIAFTTDADVDGAHISGLLMNLFDHFWPELFDLGVISVFRTPLLKVVLKDKSVLEFFTEREFKAWERAEGQKLKGWTFRWYKGLGTSTSVEFKDYFEKMDDYLFGIELQDKEDKDAIDLAFNGQRADDRKFWLETGAANFDDFLFESVAHSK